MGIYHNNLLPLLLLIMYSNCHYVIGLPQLRSS